MFSVLFICISSVTTNGQNIRYDTIRYEKPYYLKKVSKFKSEPVKTGRVIFLGNSITEFGNWPNLLNDSTVLNRGIAGDNTFGVLERLGDIVIREPSKLFIEIGINDVAQNIPASITVKNILTIVERVRSKSPKTKFYVMSALPHNDKAQKKYPEIFHKDEQVNLLNKKLKQKARKGKFSYIDFNKELLDVDGKLDTKYAKSDGLHLNETGYQLLIAFLKTKKYLK